MKNEAESAHALDRDKAVVLERCLLVTRHYAAGDAFRCREGKDKGQVSTLNFVRSLDLTPYIYVV